MTKELQKAFSRLRKVSPKLNAATDEVTEIVNLVEQFLNKECSIGLSVKVFIDANDIDEEYCECTYLAYRRVDGKFRLAVVTTKESDSDENPDAVIKEEIEITPWVSATREWKLKSFNKLPSLLTLLAEEAEKINEATNDTAQTVKEIIKSL